MGLQVFNPQETRRCSLTTARKASTLIKGSQNGLEGHNWPFAPDKLLKQMQAGLTRVALIDKELVGIILLKQYLAQGWGRLSWPFVLFACRYVGIENELVWALSQTFDSEFKLIMPVRSPINQKQIAQFGFRTTSFAWLRENHPQAWQETCVCQTSVNCPMADKECLLLVRD